MAKRIKSGIKRNEVAERNRQRNISAKSALKTATKKVEEDLSSKTTEKLKEDLSSALSRIDRAAAKGIIHSNTAARKKSRLMKKVNSATKTA
jgi:small subunit ribosomal protein S20